MHVSWNEETFKGLLESAPDAIIIVNEAADIVLINSQTEKLFGYSRNELLGQKIEVLLPNRYRNNHVGQRNKFLRSSQVRPMGAGLELFGQRKDGSEFPVEISLSPLKTPQGTLISSAIRDVTDRKKIELDLKKAREAADSANQSKSQFLANMSHEIRTPLAGILGYIEMLTQYGKTDEARQDYAVKIRRCADNLTALINDILDLSKVEAGALKVECVKISLLSEVDGAVSVLQNQAHEKELLFHTQYERPLPTYLNSDPVRLRQILVNVLGNAVKFTESGSVTLTVKQEPPFISFLVSDTGCGISEAESKLLFQPFVQADSSTTRKYGGTGLGLALSRRLAKAMGGDLILLESTPGKGSTFKITIASGDIQDGAKHAPTPKELPPSSTWDLSGTRVLLAEDNSDNAGLIMEFLTRAGAKVTLAKNGVEAVEKADSPFDVILMDIQMPMLDGNTATQRLRAKGSRVPIVALTAHAMLEEKEKCMKSGFNEYLTKPVETSVLLKTVFELTRAKNSLKQ